jgi:HAD superfamily phosphatase (TIGR01668 family)
VSNTAGTHDDSSHEQEKLLEKHTGVKVLRHGTKVGMVARFFTISLTEFQKPGCKDEVMKYFAQAEDVEITSPSQIAVVGDRLLTDVMMANMMGSYGFWIKDGVTERKSIVSHSAKYFHRISLSENSSRKRRCGYRISYLDVAMSHQILKAILSDKPENTQNICNIPHQSQIFPRSDD